MPASTPRPAVASQAVRSGSGAKEMILMWVQNRIRDYPVGNLLVGIDIALNEWIFSDSDEKFLHSLE